MSGLEAHLPTEGMKAERCWTGPRQKEAPSGVPCDPEKVAWSPFIHFLLGVWASQSCGRFEGNQQSLGLCLEAPRKLLYFVSTETPPPGGHSVPICRSPLPPTMAGAASRGQGGVEDSSSRVPGRFLLVGQADAAGLEGGGQDRCRRLTVPSLPGRDRTHGCATLPASLCLFRPRCGKGKLEDGDGINLNDIEKVLPAWQVGAGQSLRHTCPPPRSRSSAWAGPEHSCRPLVPTGQNRMCRPGAWAGVAASWSRAPHRDVCAEGPRGPQTRHL